MRQPVRVISFIQLFTCLVVLTVVAGGCAHDRFRTQARVDTRYDFDAVKTYAFDVRRKKVADSDQGKMVEQALREGLTKRGYEEVEKDAADVWISFDIGVYSYGGLSGANQNRRQQGDLTVWIFDAKTNTNIWYGWAETPLRSGDKPEPTIRAAVEAIFNRRLPDLPKE